MGPHRPAVVDERVECPVGGRHRADAPARRQLGARATAPRPRRRASQGRCRSRAGDRCWSTGRRPVACRGPARARSTRRGFRPRTPRQTGRAGLPPGLRAGWPELVAPHDTSQLRESAALRRRRSPALRPARSAPRRIDRRRSAANRRSPSTTDSAALAASAARIRRTRHRPCPPTSRSNRAHGAPAP